MGTFVIGGLLLMAGVVVLAVGGAFGIPALARKLAGPIAIVLGIIMLGVSTAINVEDGQSGVVTKKFGDNLQNGAIVATDGEKGPQAYLLPDGWHVGFWPWQYELTTVPNIDIPQGQIGVVTAKDGVPLPDGEVFAPAWESPQDMLDGMKFLSDGKGHKGPQLTVLPPGQWRYNPRLFTITAQPALEVEIGSVAVIKSNVGEEYVPEDGSEVESVNGVPIVPNGFRGIWLEPLQPNAYYLHPQAYVVKTVKTTKRVYSYTATNVKGGDGEQNNAVGVKTKDGYEFPVDVRASVKISAENAPYVVAMLGDPDSDPDNDGFDKLEELAILPSIRSIFRNTAEAKGALEYLNSRSLIEIEATKLFAADMVEFKIDVDRIYIAAIGLADTEQGQELMKTQTDKELALQQQATYNEQEKAEVERAKMVRAEEDANQEQLIAVSEASKTIAKNEGDAAKERAVGEAAAYAEKIKAFGGVSEYLQSILYEGLVDAIPQIQPGVLPQQVVISGGGGLGGLNETLLAPVLSSMAKDAAPKRVIPVPAQKVRVNIPPTGNRIAKGAK